MPITYHMSWVASTRRWKKMFRGKMHVVSCRQLGVPETKEASWRAANQWWEQEEKLADIPAEDDRVVRAAKVSTPLTGKTARLAFNTASSSMPTRNHASSLRPMLR
jgi:hypothetical protein